MSECGNRLVIIDGNSLVNRAYYAIQRPMVTKEGIFTQGIYGFLTMLNKITKDYMPDYMTVAFDRKAPTFRHQAYQAYKEGRKKMPDELAMQLPWLKEILSAMRISVLEIDGYEADDIIGTVAKRGEAAGLEPFIITGDKDALQLATDKTKVLITKKGISEFELFDADEMQAHYGFTATQFIDYKALMGDASDNIPGLPGVGEKTAAKLIHAYGSVENLIEHAQDVTPAGLQKKIIENAELARMSKMLATITTDVPIEAEPAAMRCETPDYAALKDLYVKLEFNSFLKNMVGDVASAEQSKGAAVLSSAQDQSVRNELFAGGDAFLAEALPIQTITTLDELSSAMAMLEKGEPLYLKTFGDFSHKATPLIYGISIMSNSLFYYIKVDGAHELVEAWTSFLTENDIPVIGHDLQPDIYALLSVYCAMATGGAGINEMLPTAGDDVSQDPKAPMAEMRLPRIAFDTAIAQYLLDPARSHYTMETMALEYLGVAIDQEGMVQAGGQMSMIGDDAETYAAYGELWCRAVAAMKPILERAIKAESLKPLLETVELPLAAELAAMEAVGFNLDKGCLREVGDRIELGLGGLAEGIYAVAGEEFNINSPQQLGVVLFEKMGLPAGKKTQRGYATGAEVLEKLRDKTPIIDKILEYRTLTKLKGTYIEGLSPLIAADGRIHAHFQQTVTATGRISCTEPNLQNIPIRQALGREIRRAFTPKPGCVLIGADYSQIELRILAHFSEDPALVEDFRQGADIHSRTAARVFHIEDESQVTVLQRSSAKAVNFGIIYGMSGFGLSEGLGITRAEAEKYIADYFMKHQAVKEYLDACVFDARKYGFSQTLMGRRRAIPELSAPTYTVRQLGERLAMNTPIQGSAADIVKVAMNRVCAALRADNLDAKVVLQVHDELIVEAPGQEADVVSELLKREMENACELKVPLVADVHRGESWYELK